MWAMGESLEKLAPNVKVLFGTSVVRVNCDSTQLEVEGEINGAFTFDLIVGADGVGSVVRQAMAD